MSKAADHDIGDLHGARLRTHGPIAERKVPFILSRSLNRRYRELAECDLLMNYRIFEFALTASTDVLLTDTTSGPQSTAADGRSIPSCSTRSTSIASGVFLEETRYSRKCLPL